MSRMPTVHELKAWPKYFKAIAGFRKQFEVRRNDRNFRVGDLLILREWDPMTSDYTGDKLVRRIRYKLAGIEAKAFGLKPGYCVLSLGRVRHSIAVALLKSDADDTLGDTF